MEEEGLISLQRFLLNYLFQNSDHRSERDDQFVDDTQERNLLNQPLHAEILAATGSAPNIRNSTVYRMLQQRELNQVGARGHNRQMSQTKYSPFSMRSKAHIMQRFLPNKSTKIASYNNNPVFCGLFSQDGSIYMSACKDEKIRLYDTQTWKKVNTVSARDVGWSIISTDYSPDQQWLIYSSWSSYVHLVNTTGEHSVHEALDFKPTHNRFCLFSIQFSPDSNEIIAGSSDQNLYIYDLERKVRTHRIKAHDNDINSVVFLDNSHHHILSGSDDSLIRVWDRRCINKCVGMFPGHSQGITFIDSKLDFRYFISNSKDQTIRLWDLRNMKGADFTKGRDSSFEYNSYYGARQYEQLRQRPQRHKHDQSIMTYYGHKVLQTLIRCRFSPKESTGQRYIYTGSYDGTVYIYDVLSGKLLHKLSGHNSTVRDVHWHPYKPIIVSTSWDGYVKRWDYDCDNIEEKKDIVVDVDADDDEGMEVLV